MSKQTITTAKATAIKRILACIYDLFLIIPLMMLSALIWLPFNNGVAIEPGNPLYPFMISTTAILTPILFYTYFWY
ncbi:MAG: RDD family protein, partial [Wohlfahrtiimonas sp.]